MSPSLKFVTLDVFTASQFSGNPLAIVHLPPSSILTQAQKQFIAREFNLSETVFLYEPSSESDSITTVDIFTTSAELPFAGHPTVGTGWYLLTHVQKSRSTTLRTKAGDIPVVLNPSGRVRVQVPIDFKVHASFFHPDMKAHQPQLKEEDYVNGLAGAESVVSIVKGMSFILLQLTSESALSRLQPFRERIAMPKGYLGEWNGFIGVYAFFECSDGTVRTRMFDGALEDPATGSAASALSGWLGKRKGHGRWNVEIVQGVEMGRRSEIGVAVVVDSEGEVKSVELEGGAVAVMEGSLNI